jgi:hypothetical protein
MFGVQPTRWFISSTNTDLRYHRAKVTELLGQLGVAVVRLDDYFPSARSPMELLLDEIAQADAVLVLVAWRYGYVPVGETRSSIEIEYDAARQLGKPVYGFLAAPNTEQDDRPEALFPAQARDPEHNERLRAFRDRVAREQIVSFFTSPDDLAKKVAKSVFLQQQAPTLPEPDLSDTSKVFLSYRRKDMPHAAGRIYDWLVWHFGESEIFIDVRGIPIGTDFRPYVRRVIAQCIVELVVIGPRWVRMKDKQGNQRLAAPNDMVRVEIETGLEHDIALIPIYLDRTVPPDTEDLPESLHPLCAKNGLPVRDGADFSGDMRHLIDAVEGLVRPPRRR